jgi:hypothetical protein
MLPSMELKDAAYFVGVVVMLAMGWAKMQADTKRTIDALASVSQAAQEALRQAQSAHGRIDSLTLGQQALEVAQARLDERQKFKNTARFRLDNPEDNS